MEISEVFPKDGQPQRLYCGNCQGHLDLQFADFYEMVSGVEIGIENLPVLRCTKCEVDYLPDKSRFAIIELHKQAFEKKRDRVSVSRNKTDKDYGFGVASFIYDSDDYEYIPGLKRPWNIGFLTPVFFNREVLIKYDASPVYRLSFASATYGEIRRGENFSIPFGINKNGKVVMWLGDIAELPDSEQYYLRSENVESDHSIGSEFYDGQIECIFTELSRENALFKSRSRFLENCFNQFDEKIAHLDDEVLELSISFNAPVVDTEKERRHVADTLNKIYVESFDNKALGRLIERLGGDPKSLGSIKRLQKFIELSFPAIDAASIMSPFYILYDFRVAYSHLSSDESSRQKLDYVCDRLGVEHSSDLMVIYRSIIESLRESFDKLSEELEAKTENA